MPRASYHLSLGTCLTLALVAGPAAAAPATGIDWDAEVRAAKAAKPPPATPRPPRRPRPPAPTARTAAASATDTTTDAGTRTPPPHAATPPASAPPPHAATTPASAPPPHAATPPASVPAPHAATPPASVPAPHAATPPASVPAPHAALTPASVPPPHAATPPDAAPPVGARTTSATPVGDAPRVVESAGAAAPAHRLEGRAAARSARAQVSAGALLATGGLAGLGVMASGLYIHRISERDLARGAGYPAGQLAPIEAQHRRSETMIAAGAVSGAVGLALGAALLVTGARELRAGRRALARVRVAPTAGGLLLTGRF